MRKINGKELSEIIKELKNPFTSYAADYNGNAYIPYEIVRLTADKILGLNYSDETEVLYKVIEGEHVVTAKVVITIYDDDGNLVSSRTGVRSDKFNRYSKNNKTLAGQIEWSGDTFSSVTSKAFRKAFTKFGLGSQFSEAKAVSSMLYQVQGSNKSEESHPKPEKLRGYVTFVSTEDNKTFVFSSPEGNIYELNVSNANSCTNFAKLKQTAPGSTIQITFNNRTHELLGVA